MSKIIQINSHVDRRISPAFFQVEIIEIDAETRELNLVDLITSDEIEERFKMENKTGVDCEIKMGVIHNYLFDNYNYFDRDEKIHIYAYDKFIKDFITRLNKINLKLQFPIIKSHYKKNSIEDFIELLVDRYGILDKRNKTHENFKNILRGLIPIFMNSPRKEIVYHSNPICRNTFNRGEYDELEQILFMQQSELVSSTKKIIDARNKLSKTAIATQIHNARNRKRNKMKRLKEEGKI